MTFLKVFLQGFYYTTKKINNIDDFYTAKSTGLTIANFDIVNQSFSKSNLEEKRINKRKTQKYYQFFYAFPFKSKENNFYYALQFERLINNSSDSSYEIQYNQFLKETRDTLKHYNFQYTHHFELVDSNRKNYIEALPNKNNDAIFLKPVKTLKKIDKQKTIINALAVLLSIFILYTAVIFVLENKNFIK